MNENGHQHCWHTVGTAKRSTHGRFLPREARAESAMRCCHCGRYEAVARSNELQPDEIDFADGCEPFNVQGDA